MRTRIVAPIVIILMGIAAVLPWLNQARANTQWRFATYQGGVVDVNGVGIGTCDARFAWSYDDTTGTLQAYFEDIETDHNGAFAYPAVYEDGATNLSAWVQVSPNDPHWKPMIVGTPPGPSTGTWTPIANPPHNNFKVSQIVVCDGTPK